MDQVLHGSARTTPATRQAIYASTESLAKFAIRYGLNEKTVAKWRGRPTSQDAPMGRWVGARRVFNSDQGSQFTSGAYERAPLATGCRISRDGRGRATDNAFSERLWRTVKREHTCRSPAADGQHLILPTRRVPCLLQPPPAPSKPARPDARPRLPSQRAFNHDHSA